MKTALTIAGSDSGGGAGIQADILTFAANKVFATSAISSLTAQNPDGVLAVEPVSPNFLRAQLEAVWSYFKPEGIKCGMLFNAELIETVADFFKDKKNLRLVIDPVMISTSGSVLLKPDAVSVLLEKLVPLASLITPNLDEAAHILNCKKITSADIEIRAEELFEKLKVPVLLKGGHLADNENLVDVFLDENAKKIFSSKRILNVNTHGSGCTLSAAIAARLALGDSILDAVKNARDYLFDAMKNPLKVKGVSFINHK